MSGPNTPRRLADRLNFDSPAIFPTFLIPNLPSPVTAAPGAPRFGATPRYFALGTRKRCSSIGFPPVLTCKSPRFPCSDPLQSSCALSSILVSSRTTNRKSTSYATTHKSMSALERGRTPSSRGSERAKPPNNWLKRANAVALNLQPAVESVRLMAVFLQLWQYCRIEL
jgi:hypothetical protein